MKKIIYFTLLSAFLLSCGNNKNSESGNVTKDENGAVINTRVPYQLPYDGGSELILNGRGFRNKFFVKVYECGLYLPTLSNNPNEIINSDSAVTVRLVINSNLITKSNMTSVIREGFVKATNNNTANIQPQIDRLMELFQQFPVNVGNVYDMWYLPGKGVQGYLNEKPWGPIIECTPEFRHALIGIWLCDNPADKDLKVKMLGL